MISHPGQRLDIYDIGAIANEAYQLAFTTRNIISGFERTGIYPFNSNIFSDSDFSPSEVTDRPQIVADPDSSDTSVAVREVLSEILCSVVGEHRRNQGSIQTFSPAIDEQAATSVIAIPSTPPSSKRHIPQDYVSPKDIMPFPKAGARKGTRKGKKGRSMILTSSPEKQILEKERNGQSETNKKSKLPTKKSAPRKKPASKKISVLKQKSAPKKKQGPSSKSISRVKTYQEKRISDGTV